MIKEAYVNFEIAELLKEKEFDEKTATYYEDGVLDYGNWFEWNRSPLGHIAAPTLQMACAWLREKHLIHVYAEHKAFFQEKPTTSGEYLVRGIGGLNNKLHHWVCLWIADCEDDMLAHRFFYGGNEFINVPSGKFEWMDLKEL